MTDLESTNLGNLDANSNASTSENISAYVTAALSAETVALGGNDSTHKNIDEKAYRQCVVLGYNAEATDAEKDSNVVAIGAGASANNWGTAVGVEAKANLGLAFGANAWAEGDNNPMALGRYAKATGTGAVQLNGDKIGDEYKAVNSEDYTLKFYAGEKGNVTIVNAEGKISADTSLSVKVTQLDDTLADMRIKMVNAMPETPEDGILYFVVS